MLEEQRQAPADIRWSKAGAELRATIAHYDETAEQWTPIRGQGAIYSNSQDSGESDFLDARGHELNGVNWEFSIRTKLLCFEESSNSGGSTEVTSAWGKNDVRATCPSDSPYIGRQRSLSGGSQLMIKCQIEWQ